MRQATRTQWIKCTIAILLYLAFLIWVRSWWGLIVVPFIFDIYITKKIPWSFWKKSKNPTVRNVMSWVDAIVFALVAVYFVNIYIFQNYQIPSSSLEKSLLVAESCRECGATDGTAFINSQLSTSQRRRSSHCHIPVSLQSSDDLRSYLSFHVPIQASLPLSRDCFRR